MPHPACALSRAARINHGERHPRAHLRFFIFDPANVFSSNPKSVPFFRVTTTSGPPVVAKFQLARLRRRHAHARLVNGLETVRFAHVIHLERFIVFDCFVKRGEIWLEPFRPRLQKRGNLLLILLRQRRDRRIMVPRQVERKIPRKFALENNLAFDLFAIIDPFVRLVGRMHAARVPCLPSSGPSPMPSATARDRTS